MKTKRAKRVAIARKLAKQKRRPVDEADAQALERITAPLLAQARQLVDEAAVEMMEMLACWEQPVPACLECIDEILAR